MSYSAYFPTNRIKVLHNATINPPLLTVIRIITRGFKFYANRQRPVFIALHVQSSMMSSISKTLQIKEPCAAYISLNYSKLVGFCFLVCHAVIKTSLDSFFKYAIFIYRQFCIGLCRYTANLVFSTLQFINSGVC